MDLVCASPSAHQFGSVLGIRRSFASGCAASAFYGEEVLSFEGEYCFSLFFLWIFWGKQKKSGFFGKSGFFIGVLGEYRL